MRWPRERFTIRVVMVAAALTGFLIATTWGTGRLAAGQDERKPLRKGAGALEKPPEKRAVEAKRQASENGKASRKGTEIRYVGKPRASNEGSGYHAGIDLERENRGGPGRLRVFATFKIGQPNQPAPDVHDVDFEVVVTIDNLQGKVYVDHEVIGRGRDIVGKGNWEQDYAATYRLPPGKYRVEVMAHDPTRRATHRDGSKGPVVLGSERRGFSIK